MKLTPSRGGGSLAHKLVLTTTAFALLSSAGLAADGCTPERAGGSLTLGTLSEAVGLDPLGVPSLGIVGGSEIAALYDTLMTLDRETNTVVPKLAESVTPDAEGKVFTVKLRSGIKFGSGNPLTADAAIASINRHRAETNRESSRTLANNIADIRKVDDLTFDIELVEPWPAFTNVLTSDIGMITDPAVVEERGEDFAKNPTGAGTGPYELQEYAQGRQIVLKAKTDYWGGPVCIDTLTFVQLQGAQSNLQALQAGDLTVAFIAEPQVLNQARTEGFQSLSDVVNMQRALVMNSGANGEVEPATANVLVRQAVAAAVSPEIINNRVYDGAGLASSAVIGELSPIYAGLTGPAYDLEKAKALVAEAKAAGWDGKIRLLGDNLPTQQQYSVTVKAMLEAAGFEVDSKNVPIPEVIKDVIFDRNYDLVNFSPTVHGTSLWSDLNRPLNSQSPANYFNYASPEMDAALVTLKSAQTIDEQKAAMVTVQDLFNTTVPALPILSAEEAWVFGENVKGLRLDYAAVLRFENAYIEK